jgi:diaminohydroxyphosphoribosylaminopyrimidine deaminase/5-amino-6-(5-phosphoribosylamino)uracil reductase
MARALELAARGRFGVSPNPMVGAVVLDSAGRLAGEGWHATYGGPHAEVVALDNADQAARGGTLYVTLEPCAHHGKTPPCVDAIVSAGVRRVVFAHPDPTATASGGADRLRAEGVEVREGPGAEQARILNRRWLRWARHKRPWVTVKAAISLDGRVATSTGQSQWITGESARARSLELREEHDAILVGIGTVLADNPRLTRRLGLNPVSGWRRIVLDSRLRLPSDAEVIRSEPAAVLVAHTSQASEDDRRRLIDLGVGLVEVSEDEFGRVDVDGLLGELAQREVSALLVEGGPTVHGSFADDDLVDEVVFFLAPFLIGGEGVPAVAGKGIPTLELARRLRFEAVRRHGDDLEISAVRPEDEDVHGVG